MTVIRTTGASMSADAFLAWSGRQGATRHELLDGRVVEMGAERAIHVRTKFTVTRCLERAIAEAGLDCEALVDGMAVIIGAATVFEPDALVRCGKRLADEAASVADPVIVVEVASPSTERIDALIKLTRYFENASIMHYLIVMPADRRLLHHRRGAGEAIETSIWREGRLRLDPPGLDLQVEALFPPS